MISTPVRPLAAIALAITFVAASAAGATSVMAQPLSPAQEVPGCPTGLTFRVQAIDPDMGAAYVVARNPFTKCAIRVTITGKMWCTWDGPNADGFRWGPVTSESLFIPKGSTKEWTIAKAFPQAAKQCRDRMSYGKPALNIGAKATVVASMWH